MTYFFDPVLFAPMWGCMLMCLIASCIGVFVVLRRESLLGEALSHAAYPGVILALLLLKIFLPEETGYEITSLAVVFAGAFVSCFTGIYVIRFLQRKRVPQDAALAFVLSTYFGLGILLLSLLQSDYPTLYREMQALLFGQAATMVTLHVVIYAVLAVISLLLIVLFIRPIQTTIFDPTFARTIGMSQKRADALLFFLIVFATVIGIRSVGVVLLSAMLIFPAATGRLFVKKLSSLLLVAAILGLFSGLLGVISSHELSRVFMVDQRRAVSFPTGPMIVMWASLFFVLALLFAPGRGLVFRAIRKATFLLSCRQENLLKAAWKFCAQNDTDSIRTSHLRHISHESPYALWFLLLLLKRKGYVRKKNRLFYELTPVGMLWGRKIVRLHRLWEAYLVEFCKVPKERVHPLAEEMEHILTEEIEQELNEVLHHPMRDPHNALIPPKEGGV